MPPKQTPDAASLKLLREYLALASTCDICGASCGGYYRVVVGIEWRDDIPHLLARQTVCTLCVSDLPDFVLQNPLRVQVGALPAEVRRQTMIAERQEDRSAAKALTAERLRLASALASARTPSARAKLREEMDLLVTDVLGIDAATDGLGSMCDRSSDADDPILPPPNRSDLRFAVHRFLQSPYRNALPHELQNVAYLFAAGLSESAIAKQTKRSQATVSRQIRTILHTPQQRR